MAVTNHPKVQEKPPAWATRAKLRLAHVYGGPSETAKMILFDGWNKSPEVLMLTSRYGSDLVQELTGRKINAVCLTWSPGFSHEGDAMQWELVRKLLPLLKKKKIKTIAAISLTLSFGDELFKRVPDAAKWTETGDDDKPVTHFDGKCHQMSLASEGWRHYVGHKIRAAIEAGFDGLFFDGVLAEPEEAANALRELKGLAKSLRPADAEELLFYSHTSFFSVIHEVTNAKFIRAGRKPGFADNVTLSINLPVLKLLFEDGGRDKVYSSGFYLGDLEDKEVRLALAEMWSTGGICNELKVPEHQQNFYLEHTDLFSGDPIGTVGVLVNDAAWFQDNINACAPFCNMLALANIQFDVIPLGQIANFELRKYKVLSALHNQALSPDAVKALEMFATEHGGTILAGPETGTLNQHGLDAVKPALFQTPEGASGRIETPVGNGRVISYLSTSDKGMDYIVEEEHAAAVAEDLKKFAGEVPIEVHAPEGIIALLWGKGTRRWVHVLNYRNDVSEAEIILPGCGGRTMHIHSPDEQPPGLNVTDTGSARASFKISGLDTYAIVEVV
jgi:hypothetical protein